MVRQSVDEIAKRYLEINTLQKITTQINRGVTLNEILNNIYDSFKEVLPYDRIGLALLSDDRETLTSQWARSEAPELIIQSGYTAQIKGSSLERVLNSGKPRILNDLNKYLREHPESESTKKIVKEGVRSSFTCPLIANGQPIGVIFFSSFKPNTYRKIHIELFLQITGELSLIIEKGRLFQKLLEMDKQKDRFLGIVAHDLRGPVGSMKAFLYVFRQGILGPVSDQQKEISEELERTCDRMGHLIDDLLDISTIASGKLPLSKTKASLLRLLKGLVVSAAFLAKTKKISIKFIADRNLPSLMMDADRLGQAVNNLITNAIKFSPENTTVTIRAVTKKDKVAVSVSDEGKGIPKKEQSLIFNAYQRGSTKPTADEKSTGLGLSIVKSVIEAHGGSIKVRSQLGKGTTFTCTLPVKGK